MIASELIKVLKQKIKEKGDLECVFLSDGREYIIQEIKETMLGIYAIHESIEMVEVYSKKSHKWVKRRKKVSVNKLISYKSAFCLYDT